jgi:hypothetical protein
VADDAAGEVRLSVRRRSLGLEAGDGLALRGVIAETLLFGDEREVVVNVEGVGRVTAVLDARESRDLEVGHELSLHAPAAEVLLVPVV